MHRFWGTERFIATALFVIVSSVYFATISGITSSNDGSHYALVRAMADRGSFEISPYMDFTEHQDYALRGDLRFSDRPPGTALVATPLYALSQFAPHPIVIPSTKHDPGNPRAMYAVLTSALAGAGIVSLLYLTGRQHFERSRSAMLLAALALAFGTVNWKYGSVLFSHTVSGLCIWMAVYLVLKSWEKPLSLRSAALLGFVLGYAPLVEYTNVPASIFLALAWLAGIRPLRRWLDALNLKSVIVLTLAGLIPAAFLLTYNTLNFGSPFELSTFNVDTTLWPQNEGMASDFATPLLEGMTGLLFYGDSRFGLNQGIFLLAPITILSLFGLWSMTRHSGRKLSLTLGLFLIMLLIFAKSTTYNSSTNDGRYLTPFIGLWFLPLAFAVDRFYLRKNGEITQLIKGLALFGLIFLSIRNQFVHIAFSWNYDFDVTRLNEMAVHPADIAYLFSTVFPNAPNLPILWLGEAAVIGIVLLIHTWRSRQIKMMSQPSSAD